MRQIVTSNNAVHPPVVPPRMAPSRRLDDGDVVEAGVAGTSVEVGDAFEAVGPNFRSVK